ncbi:MAG: ACT domain-containing protein, partial [Planctomycetota bacterium]
TESPLFGMPGVLCTPHLGASTEEAQTNVAVEAAELLIDFFTTGAIKHAVNMSPLDPKTLEALRGFLNIAYRLGLLLAQVSGSPPTACRMRYTGDVATKDTRLLSAAFAAGLLEHAMEAEVNIVNAELLLRERGIELIEERSSDVGEFSSLITAEVVSDERTAVASGTLFGKNMPRLVQKRDCRLESCLHGIFVLITFRDAPGVIGRIGNVFGKHRINIAQMSVGRSTDKPGGEQMAVLSLDGPPSAEALADVLAMDAVREARIAHLPPPHQLPAWMGG